MRYVWWHDNYDSVTIYNYYDIYREIKGRGKKGRRVGFQEVSSLNNIKPGQVVGEFDGDLFIRALIVPGNNKYIGFHTFRSNKINVNMKSAWDDGQDKIRVRHYLKTEDMKSFIKDCINEGIYFNVDEFKCRFISCNSINKTQNLLLDKYPIYNLDTDHGGGMYGQTNNYCAKTHYYNATLFEIGIIDKQTYDTLKDEYAKGKIQEQLEEIKTNIIKFKSTQTSFDNCTEFDQILTML